MPFVRPAPFPPVPGGVAVLPTPAVIAPDFQQIAGHPAWREAWTHVVAGRFSDSPFTGVLFYEEGTGAAEFYETDGLGNPRLLAAYGDWHASWTHIAVGRFSDSPYSGLLLYDQAAGWAQFYATDGQGGIRFLSEDDTWRTSWDEIVVGRYSRSNFDGLLLYDRANGFGAFYSTDGHGHLSVLAEHDNWRTSWTAIVPGDWYARDDAAAPFTDLFFYEGETGYGETYGTDGHGGITQVGAQGALPVGARVVSGTFGGLWYDPRPDLLFADEALTIAQVWAPYRDPATDPNDPHAITWTLNEQIDLGGRGYDHLVPGNFWVATAEDLDFDDGGFTDLCLYDHVRGDLDFFLKEPQPQSIDQLEGYPSQNSVAPGEAISLHVSSSVGPFVIDVYRLGAQEEHMTRLWGLAPAGPFPRSRTAFQDGAGFPAAATFTIPSTWPSGLYVGRVIAGSSGVGATGSVEQAVGLLPAGVTLDIPFVVRSSSPGEGAAILVSVPDTTYEAYNLWGGRCLYAHTSGDSGIWVFPYTSIHAPRALRVSSRRPFRSFDPHVGRAKWKVWEPTFVAWLEREQIPYEMCTVSDLDLRPDLISNYQLFVTLGHDEYWSRQMRDSVESFIADGGNVAFLSGNTCYWQIRLEDGGDTIVCYKDADLDPLAESDPSLTTVEWSDPPLRDTERKLTGVRGGTVYDTDKPPAIWQTYNVTDENHWVFEDTGLSNGDAFGFYIRPDGQIRSVMGTETDATGKGTPGSFHVLAKMYDGSTPHNDVTATMVTSDGHDGRGTVFSAATIDWVLGLTTGGGTPMDQITRNVLGRLSGA